MRTHRLILSVVQLAALLYCAQCAVAQPSDYEQFRAHNAQMADLQPTWMGPLIQSDPRLSQAIRLSVSDANAPGEQIVSYGNNHGVSVIAERRFQLEFDPPSFFRNHSAAYPGGFGNAGAQIKYLIASSNSEHRNFAVTAIDFHGFAPRAAQNGMFSAYDCPKIAAGIARDRFNMQSTLGGLLQRPKLPRRAKQLSGT